MLKPTKPGELFNKFKKKHSKSHSAEAIKGLKTFAEEEGKEKSHKHKNWIAGAIKKPGALRKSLGVKEGKTIPKKTLTKVAKKGGVTGKRARLAQTLASFHHKTESVHKAHKSEHLKMHAHHMKMHEHHKMMAEHHKKQGDMMMHKHHMKMAEHHKTMAAHHKAMAAAC